MISPVPWSFRDVTGRRESDLAAGAIDETSYPPYRLVWVLEVFDKKTDRLVTEIVLERFDVGALRRLYRRPPSDPMCANGWPVTGKRRRKAETLTGQKFQLPRYSYFIAASALNYHEVNKSHD